MQDVDTNMQLLDELISDLDNNKIRIEFEIVLEMVSDLLCWWWWKADSGAMWLDRL
jgi:hypothetical protein